MLFFQVVLLAGYGYAYLLTAKLGPRRGAVLHVAMTILPLMVLAGRDRHTRVEHEPGARNGPTGEKTDWPSRTAPAATTNSATRVMPLFVILVAISLLARGLEPPPWAMFVVHLGGLLLIATALHGQLAELRPPVEHLTEYYFWIALGGAAGGALNALAAPLLAFWLPARRAATVDPIIALRGG